MLVDEQRFAWCGFVGCDAGLLCVVWGVPGSNPRCFAPTGVFYGTELCLETPSMDVP